VKILEKLKIKKMHIFAALAVLVCISLLSAYIYAHSYVKNRFIEKLASRGIEAKVESVSLKSEVTLSGIFLKVKDSSTSIKSITSNYWLTDIRIADAHVHGKVEDYLQLKSKAETTPAKEKTGRSMSIKLQGCEAELTFRGRKVKAQKLSFSTDDSIVRAEFAGVDALIMQGVDFNLNTNKAHITKLYLIPEVQHKDSGKIDIKDPEPMDFHIPTLPNVHYEIDIDQVGDSDAEFGAEGLNIKIDTGKTFSLKVKGKEIKYDFYHSNEFSFEVGGTATSFKYALSAKKPYLFHEKIRTDVHDYPMSANFSALDISGHVSVSDKGITVKEGLLELDKVLMKYSFGFDGDLKEYKFSMPRTDCEQIMLANPFKDVFHNRCDSAHVDIGRCNAGDDTLPEDTEYSGIMEWSVSGKTVSDPRFGFYSTCSFKSVPWYLKKSRFRRPFSLRVGEPIEKGTNWKPRREIMVGPGTNNWVPGNLISYYLERALMVTEDGRFWFHKGIDDKAVSALIKEVLTKREFDRGGSTITMQLAKNLWLMRQKTLSRKVEEFFLTLYLESIMSKAEIMQLYLNIIEFGPNVYGIYDASKYYFKKVPFDLTLKESVFLASILPKPSANYFVGGKLGSGTNSKVNYLLGVMFARKLITQEELDEARAEVVYRK